MKIPYTTFAVGMFETYCMVVMVMTSPEVAEDGFCEEEEVDSPDYEERLPEVWLHMDPSLSFVVMAIMAMQPECLENIKK